MAHKSPESRYSDTPSSSHRIPHRSHGSKPSPTTAAPTARNRQPRRLDSSHLGTKPLLPLLWRLSIPAALAMGSGSLNTLVDILILGRVFGSLSVAAVAITFPITISQIAFGVIFGVGSSSIISRSLGAKQIDNANRAFSSVIFSGTAIGIVLGAVTLILLNHILPALGASPRLFQDSKAYSTVLAYGAPFQIFSIALAATIRSEGKAHISTIAVVIGIAINIILNYLFAVVLRIGVQAVAWATFIGQGITTLIFLGYYTGSISELTLCKMAFKKIITTTKAIFSVGFGASFRQVGDILLLILVNNLIINISNEQELSAFGVVNRVVILALLPLIGLAQGMFPIAGYNWGAKQYTRSYQIVTLANKLALFIGMAISLGTFLFARPSFALFIADPAVVSIGATMLRIMIFTVPFITIQLISAVFFQAIGVGKLAVLIHGIRQLILIPGSALLLSRWLGTDGIVIGYLLSDVLLGAVLYVVMLIVVRRHSFMPQH